MDLAGTISVPTRLDGVPCSFEKQYLLDTMEVTQTDGQKVEKHLLPTHTPSIPDILEASDASKHVSSDGSKAASQAPLERPMIVDVKGRALATGRRKASSARVWVSYGVGDTTVNGQPMPRYFTRSAHRGSALAPLMALAAPQGYTVRALVEGGGASCVQDATQLLQPISTAFCTRASPSSRGRRLTSADLVRTRLLLLC